MHVDALLLLGVVHVHCELLVFWHNRIERVEVWSEILSLYDYHILRVIKVVRGQKIRAE